MKTNAWIMAKCAGVLVLALGLSNSAYGQAVGANASISGSVQDSTGAVIPNADIEIENINTGAKRTTVSNAVGSDTCLSTTKMTCHPNWVCTGSTVVSPGAIANAASANSATMSAWRK